MPILYRGHFVFMHKPRMTTTGINTSALFLYVTTIVQLIEQRNPTHIALVFDSTTPTFRHEAYPEYKAQRDKLPEDIAMSIGMAYEFAEAMNIKTLRKDGFEADDLMGTLAKMGADDEMDVYLVSPDKDIAQLVEKNVYLYRLGGSNPEVLGVQEVCDHWKLANPGQMIDYLALAGDSSDNIPGVKGIGEKTAQKLLSQYSNIEAIIAAAQKGEIAGKIGTKLVEKADDARLSLFLTTIRQDVPLTESADDFKCVDVDTDAMSVFLSKYELTTIAKRLGIDIKQKNSQEEFNFFDSSKESKSSGAAGADTGISSIETTPHEYKIIRSEDDLNELAATLKAANIFSFDTETTSTDARVARLVGISFSTEAGKAWYLPYHAQEFSFREPEPVAVAEKEEFLLDLFGENTNENEKPLPDSELPVPPEETLKWKFLSEELIQRTLAPVFADTAIEKVGHNSKYDREVLARYGMSVSEPCHDTMLMHFVLNASERHGLNRLARIYLNYETIPISRLIGEDKNADPGKFAKIEPTEICDYSAEDADITLRLYNSMLPEIRAAGLEDALLKSEEPLVQVLTDMESDGVKLDVEKLRVFGKELEREITSLEIRIFFSAGEEFNLSSPKQLGEILFGKLAIDEKAARTSNGQFITSEEVLQKYAPKHEIVQNILQWRGAEKLRSTYVDKLPGCVNPDTGRVHTHFSQSFTETGRLSSADPNLQNIPVRTEQGKRIRDAIVADGADRVLISADYSQIELRIMAALANDEAMLEAFREGRDIHTETAARVFSVPAEEVTPEQRSHCKMVNFGIIYGMSTYGLAQRLNIPRGDAAKLIDEYFKQYPAVKAFMDKAIADAREAGYAKTILGRRRVLRDISSRNSVLRQAAERNAINTPVQGSAADLIKLAMVRVSRALKKEELKAKLILQIHDELLVEADEKDAKRVSEVLRESMLNAYDFGVPLEVEIGIGKTWLEAH